MIILWPTENADAADSGVKARKIVVVPAGHVALSLGRFEGGSSANDP
jgi:hypothetical protein